MNPNETVSLSRVIGAFFYLLIFPVILFSLAGDLRWAEGWLFSILFLIMCYGPLFYLYFHDPALLKERFGAPIQKDQKPWDKLLLMLFFIDFIIWFAIMPLDARRFHWSTPFPFWAKIVGTLLLLLAGFLLFETLRENTFAAPVVKLQKERGQKVISTGLYAIVRHPMYAGAVLLFIGTPLLLGSFFGLIFAVLLIATIGARSLGEEAMLKQELEGYGDYMKKVKWRMVPFVF